MDRLLVSLKEGAATLDISIATMQRLAYSGQIGTVVLKGRRLVPVSELHRFIERKVAETRGEKVPA